MELELDLLRKEHDRFNPNRPNYTPNNRLYIRLCHQNKMKEEE